MTPQDTMQLALEALIWECGSEPALYAQKTAEAIEALREALAQQGEPQPYLHVYEYDSVQFGVHREFYPREWNGMKPTRTVPLYTAAPAAQPTCKQDLQVPTVKESLSVETEQERYVRMCPDIECGRKKQCARMVGVSCMSRADIAPAAQGCDYCNHPLFAGLKCKNCGREFAPAALSGPRP